MALVDRQALRRFQFLNQLIQGCTEASEGGQTITVDTSAGPATVTLPDGITGEDRLRVVQTILKAGADEVQECSPCLSWTLNLLGGRHRAHPPR